MSTADSNAKVLQEIESLRRASGIINSLIEDTGLGIAVINAEYRVIEVNKKIQEWFPDLDTTLQPFCYNCLVHDRESICTDCPTARTLEQGVKNTSYLTRLSCGRERVFKVSCIPLRTHEVSWGVLAVFEDVTEERAREEKVKGLEAQYRLLIENASDAIIMFNRNGEVLQINKKAQELSGYSAEELVGGSVFILMPDNKRTAQHKIMEDIFSHKLDSKLSNVVEGRLLKKDGTVLPIEETLNICEDTLTAIIRDISERKQYESTLKQQAENLEHEVELRTRELKHSEDRYLRLVETANDAIISTDRSGSVTYFNKKAEELYGYRREDVLGSPISLIAPPDMARLAKRESWTDNGFVHGRIFESQGIKKDKSTFPLELTISVFEGADDGTVTFIARDITIRKSLERELQEYTATLEEKVRDRTYELTASQQTLKSKLAELSILQEISEALASAMELEDVLNIILVGATSHHGLGFNRAFVFLVSEDGRFIEGSVAIGPSDGQEAQKIWGEILGKNLTLKEILKSYTNKSGRIDAHVNSIIRDIRIPVNAEDHILARVVRECRAMNIHDAYTSSLVPNELLSIMGCNAFALIPLVAEDNALGVLWADNAITRNAIEDRDIDRLHAFALNASLAIEKSNLYKNIQQKVNELALANTELQQNRDRLIRSEKLAAVGEMSATVAHGIRNPLVSIGGFARRMLKKEDGDTTNRKYLQIIVDEIDRLETILSELLDFVRPRKLRIKQVSIIDIIKSTLDVFSLEFDGRNISVERDFDAGLPVLEVDPDQFKRVLHNLFNNAMEAMPEGGMLRVSAQREEEWIRLSIADTGEGIADDDMEKVFHPFFTSKSTGSGLGLAVCNQIISIHGGHIKLKRQLPHGMILDVFLPVPQ